MTSAKDAVSNTLSGLSLPGSEFGITSGTTIDTIGTNVPYPDSTGGNSGTLLDSLTGIGQNVYDTVSDTASGIVDYIENALSDLTSMVTGGDSGSSGYVVDPETGETVPTNTSKLPIILGLLSILAIVTGAYYFKTSKKGKKGKSKK
ncbi:hypothetical protein [Methanococcus maripaludis]|uniref:Uncharacterized protein n=1 Tax=Methanococcus maripaludis TaxID=39152 RepID=A0A8T3VYG7_METMI|nr:hypothetical protein [Methanococcus maripaludis]MBG0769678.1 hypothetical protein [Methanococcus maripaludis]